MGGARRVPWRDWSEWDRVRSGLCGDDPEARDASIARVADWRRRGRVPHAVDCTASLLETRALDAGVPGNVTGASPRLSAPLSENMLRLAYAAALVRMVNGAVDPSQKGKYAAPVMTLAKRMGIPAVLVDVRMAASHQEMPALALLSVLRGDSSECESANRTPCASRPRSCAASNFASKLGNLKLPEPVVSALDWSALATASSLTSASPPI